MAFENRVITIPGELASADFSTTGQHRFVTIGASGPALAAAGARVDGVLANNPGSGEPSEVLTVGSVAKVEASAAIAKGADVASAANGQAVTAATTNYIAGKALTAVGAAGELVSVLLLMPGREP